MSGRADYLIQVLEKIGTPLMTGLIDAGAKGAASGDDVGEQAQKIASLLSCSVKFGIDIGNLVDLNAAGAEGDRLRIALTALASALVAEQFKHGGKTPDDTQIKKMTAALQAVITFSDNFAPDDANTQALEGMAVKTLESNVHYIEALLPVISAVGAFAFGQSEAKMLQDVSSRLSQNVGELATALLSEGLSGPERKQAELAVLRALARLYADAHNGEVAKLMALDEAKRMSASISADTVWSVFETRMAMLKALAENMVPGGASASAPARVEPVPVAPPAAEPPPQETPPQQPPPAAETPLSAPPPVSPPASSAQEQPAANPMAMFAKKPAAPQAPVETPPPAPPAEIPAQTPPEVPESQVPATPAQPPALPTEIPPPPAETPPAAPPADVPPDKPVDKPAGNPMSFFKSPPKKEGDADNA